jgi:diguanylate cyclase (GGDEF)-like protein
MSRRHPPKGNLGGWPLHAVLIFAMAGIFLPAWAQPATLSADGDPCHGLADTASITRESIASFRRGDYTESARLEHCVLQRALDAGDRKAEAQSLNNLGVLAKRRGEAEQAMEHYQRALAIRRAIGDTSGIAQSLNNIAVVHKNWGNLYQALSLQLEALPLRPDALPQARAESLDNIALIYLALGDLGEAERYSGLAIEALASLPEHNSWPRILANHAQILLQQKRYDAASEHAQRALSLAETAQSRTAESQAIGLLAQVARARGEHSEALRQVERALPLAQAVGDPKEMGELRLLKADVLLDLGQLDAAQALAEGVLRDARAAEARLLERAALELLARLAAARRDWEAAHRFASAHAEADRELTSALTGRQMADLRASLELQRQKAELDLLHRDNQIQSLQIGRQRVLGIALIGGLLALAAFVTLVGMRYRYARRANALLESKAQALERAARTDAMTSLANRFALSERLDALADATAASQSLLLVDLDRFKQINDSYGHAAGDIALRAAAEALRESFDGPLIGRWGGEEFLLISTAGDVADLTARAERFLQRLRETALSWEEQPYRVTASVGLATRRAGESVQSWLSRCDHALYAAKQAGRDRLVVAPD